MTRGGHVAVGDLSRTRSFWTLPSGGVADGFCFKPSGFSGLAGLLLLGFFGQARGGHALLERLRPGFGFWGAAAGGLDDGDRIVDRWVGRRGFGLDGVRLGAGAAGPL